MLNLKEIAVTLINDTFQSMATLFDTNLRGYHDSIEFFNVTMIARYGFEIGCYKTEVLVDGIRTTIDVVYQTKKMYEYIRVEAWYTELGYNWEIVD